jgi:MATE family multidrug resistance protein
LLDGHSLCDKAGEEDSSNQISYRQYVVNVSKLACPIVVAAMLENALVFVRVYFVGQLNGTDFAACSLAFAWFGISHSIMSGVFTATDTLLAPLLGANQLDTFALWTGASLAIAVLVAFVISGILTLCGPVMRLCGEDPELSGIAEQISYRLIPGIFP